MIDLKTISCLDVILICGLPGSGKSYYAKKYFQDSGWERVNRREIRKMLFEMLHFGKKWNSSCFEEHDENLVKHTERKIIEHLLHNNKKVIIDNTSITRISRKKYLEIAHQSRKSLGVIFINTSVQKCISRNTDEKHAPNEIIAKLYAKREIPKKDEGFRKIILIT